MKQTIEALEKISNVQGSIDKIECLAEIGFVSREAKQALTHLETRMKTHVLIPRQPIEKTLEDMEEMYMPMGEMAAAYDALITEAQKEIE